MAYDSSDSVNIMLILDIFHCKCSLGWEERSESLFCGSSPKIKMATLFVQTKKDFSDCRRMSSIWFDQFVYDLYNFLDSLSNFLGVLSLSLYMFLAIKCIVTYFLHLILIVWLFSYPNFVAYYLPLVFNCFFIKVPKFCGTLYISRQTNHIGYRFSTD